MKRINWQIVLGIGLVILSGVFYIIHYAIFRDAHHIFLYLIGDIAFVFIEVLLVTLIIHQLLSQREKRAMLKKLNMVIGAFYSEAGTGLLRSFSAFDLYPDKIQKDLIVANDWSDERFSQVSKGLKNHDLRMDARKSDLGDLKHFLLGKRYFLLRLLENPNLLEHQSFTDLLWAVFHLTEELAHRVDVRTLAETDCVHLSADMKRAYVLLISEWLNYMEHLRTNYPYLFSLALRTNPFDPNASIEVK